MTSSTPELVTHVGLAAEGDNLFRGFSVLRDLAGREGFWTAMSLAVGGPRLEAEAAGVLDDITICVLAADPRIWPLKATRLAAGHGSDVLGVSVGMMAADGAAIGPKMVGRTAEFLHMLTHAAEGRPERVADVLDAHLGAGKKVYGFGVPFRPADERLDALRLRIRARGRDGLRYWSIMEAASARVMETLQLPPNIASGAAAATLDLGLEPEQIAALQWAFFTPCFWANACEGARQRAAVLLRLPEHVIEYVGTPPRQSPRAAAAREAARSSPAASTEPPDDR